jgi:hypothetical protein
VKFKKKILSWIAKVADGFAILDSKNCKLFCIPGYRSFAVQDSKNCKLVCYPGLKIKNCFVSWIAKIFAIQDSKIGFFFAILDSKKFCYPG